MKKMLSKFGVALLILSLCLVCAACNDRQPTVGSDVVFGPSFTGDVIIPGETDAPIETDDPFETDPGDTHEHVFGEWTVTENAGCTTPGKRVRKCVSCSDTEEESVAAQGHDIVKHESKAATCTEAGFGAYETCSRCDYATTRTEVPPLGHSIVKHEGKAATCTEAGFGAYETCSRCDYTTYAEISPLGHSVTANEGKEATCTQPGYTSYGTCSRCGHTTDRTDIPALGHNIVKHESKAATCTEAGFGAYETCSR